MALHSNLPIYRAANKLLDVAVEITRSIPRDFKRLIGEKVRDECLEMLNLIFKANVSRDKVAHLQDLLERLQVVELLLRLSKEKHFISSDQYARVIDLTDKVGRQANGWKKASAASPAV